MTNELWMFLKENQDRQKKNPIGKIKSLTIAKKRIKNETIIISLINEIISRNFESDYALGYFNTS